MRPISVYIHLGYGLDAEKWKKRFKAGYVPDHVPYGYHHAEKYGCRLSYSRDCAESLPVNIFRRVISRILGFDFLHAWRNRKYVAEADIIWTHTEKEYLAISLLLLCLHTRHRPKLIAQSVWLFDRWKSFAPWRKRWVRWNCIRCVDVLTVHSPENCDVARNVIPGVPAQIMPFGISLDSFPMHQKEIRNSLNKPLRLLALGNDMHRDWKTLLHAFANLSGSILRIASRKIPKSYLRGVTNVEVVHPASMAEIRGLYGWADVVIVPLKPNLHASGITVVFEAVAQGVPVVATDTGGLRYYFSDLEIHFVPAGDPKAIQDAIENITSDKVAASKMADKAQDRLLKAGFTTDDWAKRHVELSRKLLKFDT